MPQQDLLVSSRYWIRPVSRFLSVALPALLAVLIVGRLLDADGPRSAPAAVDAEPVRPAPAATARRAASRRDMSEHEIAQRLEAIELAAGFLVRSCGVDGRFDYKVNLDPSIEHDPRYNFLRHCGAMYALGMRHDRQPDDEVRQALLRAAAYLRRTALAVVPGEGGDLMCIWSVPEVTLADAPPQAKLGGSGLGLVALCAAHRIDAASAPLDELRALARFIRFMQKDDGSFYSKYIPTGGGRNDDWTSLYYPGEAALGLLILHDIDPDPIWLHSAASALQFLAQQREGEASVPADHWALLATARLLACLEDRDEPGIDRSLLVQHAAVICEQILGEQIHFSETPLFVGGFAADGRTTPTSTRLEGLLAALDALPEPEYAVLRRRIEYAAHRAMRFVDNAQVRTGPHAGAMPRAILALPGDGSREARAFNRRATEVRIDYVQHAVCAMMQYLDRFGPEPAATARTAAAPVR